MRMTLTVGLAAAVSAVTISIASAQTQSPTAAPVPSAAPSPSPKASPAPKAKTPKRVTHSITGTIQTYDASAKTLTVKMRAKSSIFNVAGAKVYAGVTASTADELAKMGSRVTVKYVDKDGHHVATSVTVAAAVTPTPTAKPQ